MRVHVDGASSVTLGRHTPDGRRTPDAHGRRTPEAGRRTPDRSTAPDYLRSGTPDPNNPGTYVLRVPAPAGSMSAVPRRVVSPTNTLSRTPTPTRQEWKKAGAGSSNLASSQPATANPSEPEVLDGDASRVPRVSSSVSTDPGTRASVRAQPAVSEYFPPMPAPGDDAEEEAFGAQGLAPPALGDCGHSRFARSDRATVAESVWVSTSSPEDIGGLSAGEVKTGRGVLSMDGETVTSEGVEAEDEGSESAASGHAPLKRYR